jgi:hypothetical protein
LAIRSPKGAELALTRRQEFFQFPNLTRVQTKIQSANGTAALASVLATQNETVLDRIVEAARSYVADQYGGGDPYSPNPFEVLSSVGCKRKNPLLLS